MRQSIECPRFSVTIDSNFISEFQWAVHAVVEYHDVGSIDTWKEIETEVQFGLMLGIARECLNGNIRGARSVVVLVEGDRKLSGLFKGLPRSLGALRVATTAPENHIDAPRGQHTPLGDHDERIQPRARHQPRI